MHVRSWILLVGVGSGLVSRLEAAGLAGVPGRSAAVDARGGKTCGQGVLEGEVKAGEGFSRQIGNGLKVVLEPVPAGWALRVVPAAGSRPQHDYADLATPPYQSVNPLLISTDFSFRAQDVVGWNPRRFRYASTEEAYKQMLGAYEQLEKAGWKPGTAAEQDLAMRVNQSPEGVFQILDARLVAGTADQWKMAAAVASHFNQTAHTVEPPPDGRATPLGRVLWLRFRITFDLPETGFTPDRGLHLQRHPCAKS